ncbi:MAG: tetraacyldisaccharide 4'-kinase [Candidatus Omnitrophica bacterium]|nr:tetraacyldisaccharide 4'-kinase [Candidatus Omnitrophota bacterium]
MWQSLHDAWWRLATQHRPPSFGQSLVCRTLDAGSVAYRLAISVRNAAYDWGLKRRARLPCRVISIGNLTVGGTGKTTCVELIVQKLMKRKRRVAILSRGFGGTRQPYQVIWDGKRLGVTADSTIPPGELADEPVWLARRLENVPVLVGSNRYRIGTVACTAFSLDALVLDDGFQHRKLQRDCDIVLIHSRMPLSGWKLLPRGPMREPIHALRRAHVILITKADEAWTTMSALKERLLSINPQAIVATAVHAPVEVWDAVSGKREDPSCLEGRRVGLLSSIGDPEGFESTLQRLHALVAWHRRYPDHYRYTQQDWLDVMKPQGGLPIGAVVTTEKDWVRLESLAAPFLNELRVPLWVLGVRMKILSGEEELDARLDRLFAG